MKKTSLLIIIIVLIKITNAFAQVSQPKNTIALEGKIDSSIVRIFNCKELIIKIHNSEKKLLNDEETIKVPINLDLSFKINIKTSSPLIYLSFWSVNNGSNNYPLGNLLPIHFPHRFNYLDELYLFEQGDNIRMKFEKDGVLNFKGKGAEKLQCQFNIYTLNVAPQNIKARITDLQNQEKFDDALSLDDETIELLTQTRLKFLKSYKDQFSNKIYNMLYLDAEASIKYAYLLNLYKTTFTSQKAQAKAISTLQKFYSKYLIKDPLLITDSIAIIKSGYFTEYLFEKEWNAYKLYSKNYRRGDSFNAIYDVLTKKYTGTLRDQLLLICVRRLNEYFNTEIKSYLDCITANLQNKPNKDILKSWKARQFSAFPFELEDENGKIHKLSDYQGKLVVIDFWFTGCATCTFLNAAMHTIIDKYKENKDIVFISVCEDQKKETWLKSLMTGTYTSEGTINLYTNGLGEEHPLLKYYNFRGAPKQLIIGKNGELISADPPRPSNGIHDSFISGNLFSGNGLKPNPQAVLSNPSAIAFMKILDNGLYGLGL